MNRTPLVFLWSFLRDFRRQSAAAKETRHSNLPNAPAFIQGVTCNKKSYGGIYSGLIYTGNSVQLRSNIYTEAECNHWNDIVCSLGQVRLFW